MNEEEQEDFLKKFAELLSEGKVQEAMEMRDQMTIDVLVENLDSVVHNGVPYVHGGHLDEIVQECYESMKVVRDTFAAESSDDKLPPQVLGYIIGMSEVVRILQFMSQALVMKHSDEIKIPVDDLLNEIKDILGDDSQ